MRLDMKFPCNSDLERRVISFDAFNGFMKLSFNIISFVKFSYGGK